MPKYSTQERAKLNAYAHWLDQESWTAFCTFTSHSVLSVNTARRTMDALHKVITRTQNSSPTIFWVAEPFSNRSDYHVHALIKLEPTAVNVTELITNSWHKVVKPAGYKRYNRVDVQQYIPAGGAHFYLSKHLSKGTIDYDIL